MSDNSDFPGDKSALRTWARERRQSQRDVASTSRAIVDRIQQLPEFRAANRILLYLARPDEINVEGLIHASGKAGPKTWYAPRCAPVRTMSVHLYNLNTSMLRENAFGIREQDPASAPEVDPRELDLVLVPGLLFTRTGSRLGHGGGYYDRFLPLLSSDCVSVGVSSESSLVDDLPSDPWDIRVSIVVTENDVFRGCIRNP